MDSNSLSDRLTFALGKVTYHHSGLDDVLSQLLAALGDFRSTETGYLLGREFAIQRKIQIIEGLLAQRLNVGSVSPDDVDEIRACLKEARALTAERNKCVHDLYDVAVWDTSTRSGRALKSGQSIIRTSPKIGKGMRLEKIDLGQIDRLAESILTLAEKLFAITDRLSPV